MKGFVGGLGPIKRFNNGIRRIVYPLRGRIRTMALARLREAGSPPDSVAGFKRSPVQVVSYAHQVISGHKYLVKVRIYNLYFIVIILERVRRPIELSDLAVSARNGRITHEVFRR